MGMNAVLEFQNVTFYRQAQGSPPTWRLAASGCVVGLTRINEVDAVEFSVKGGQVEDLFKVMVSLNGTPQHCLLQSNFVSLVCERGETMGLQFADCKSANTVTEFLNSILLQCSQTEFDRKTDKASSQQYFHYYGQLAQQQNMLQDLVRTGTYQKAMQDNAKDFANAVVLDVGAGTGMLSFFALQAGARKVYAVEASRMAESARILGHSNGYGERLVVIKGKIEEIELPEKVDIIISEPMGILLVNERMLESYMVARKWLKPNGLMFPSTGVIYMAPFQDDYLYMETFTKTTFWNQQCFYGVDLRCLNNAAVDEYFATPVVDAFDPRIILSQPVRHTVDFLSKPISAMERIHIPVAFTLQRPATIHGLCFWFDVLFCGSEANVWLSTSPYTPLTHWYQVRCLLKEPLQVGADQMVVGEVVMESNTRQSYYIYIEIGVEGSGRTTKGMGNLKDPYYRVSDYSQQKYSSLCTPTAALPATLGAMEAGPDMADGEMGMVWSDQHGTEVAEAN